MTSGSFPLTKLAARIVAVLLIGGVLSGAIQSAPARLKPVKPASVEVSAEKLAAITPEVEREIKDGHLPGAVVLVARNGGVVWRRAYGARAVEPVREPMTADTIFDLASLTKVVATATSIMILVERGKLRLSDPLSTYIPEIKGEGREKITIELLLTHRAGYAPDFDLRERWSGWKREPFTAQSTKHISIYQ